VPQAWRVRARAGGAVGEGAAQVERADRGENQSATGPGRRLPVRRYEEQHAGSEQEAAQAQSQTPASEGRRPAAAPIPRRMRAAVSGSSRPAWPSGPADSQDCGMRLRFRGRGAPEYRSALRPRRSERRGRSGPGRSQAGRSSRLISASGVDVIQVRCERDADDPVRVHRRAMLSYQCVAERGSGARRPRGNHRCTCGCSGGEDQRVRAGAAAGPG
jgi:hypothetical protein